MTKLQKILLSANCILFVSFIAIIVYSRMNAGEFTLQKINEPYIVSEEQPEEIIRDKLININKATKEELMRIKGIGEKTAQNILDFLESNGDIDSLDELLDVKGIGESKLKTIKQYAVAGG